VNSLSDSEKETRSEVSVLLSLPRPQRPLPPHDEKRGTYHPSLADVVVQSWGDDESAPTHAWIRYSLSAGTSLREFQKTYRGLRDLKRAFGRRVLVVPVRLEHHEIELPDFLHMVEPDSGSYEIEAHWRRKRVDGGSHLLFAVESDLAEGGREDSRGLEVLDALESAARFALGAMTVVETRQTFHLELATGVQVPLSPSFRVYGAEEAPRSGPETMAAFLELAAASDRLAPEASGRLSLGMRWANIAFKESDLLSFWTAIEILAGRRGTGVYPVLAEAYALPRSQGQVLAKQLGIAYVYQCRGAVAHDGRAVHVDPRGASFLFAVAHDLARHVADLPPMRYAEKVMAGSRAEGLFWPER